MRVRDEGRTYALDQVTLDLPESLGLLERIPADIERKLVDVDEDLDPVQMLLNTKLG
jgi:hypothetical protein